MIGTFRRYLKMISYASMIRFIFLYLGIISFLFLQGQDSLDIVLLKNEQEILPIKHLDSAFIFSKVYSYEEEFEQTLAKYTLIYSERKDTMIPPIKGPWIDTLLTDSIFVYGIDLVRSPRGIQTFLNQIPDSTKTIACFWGSLINLQAVRIPDHLDAILYTPQFSKGAISGIAQAVFGGIPVNGVLTDSISEQFPVGTGLKTNKIRLGYASLTSVGMNDTLIQDSISQITLSAIADSAFPGAQILIAKDGYVVYHEAFGYHTYDRLDPVRTEDIYDFASVSKITAGLPPLMKMHSEGRFDLDKPLEYYVPEMKGSNKGNIAMRQILAHNARIQSWIAYWTTAQRKNGHWKWRTIKPDSSKRFNIWLTDDMWLHHKYKKRIYKMIRKSPLYPEPGYVYSGLLFYLIPGMVEQQENHPSFEQYLKENFYRPLGAYSLTHNAYQYYGLDRIIPTERDTFFRMTQLHGMVHDEGAAMMGGVSANAGLFGTANDLAKLAQMYTNYGHYGGREYIAESTLKEFASCQYCDQDNRRGLGFERPMIEYDREKSHVAQSVSDLSFGHSGYTGTFVWMDPKYDLIYIFFSNRVYPTRLNRKLYEMNIRPRIQQVIYDSFLGPQKTSLNRNPAYPD